MKWLRVKTPGEGWAPSDDISSSSKVPVLSLKAIVFEASMDVSNKDLFSVTGNIRAYLSYSKSIALELSLLIILILNQPYEPCDSPQHLHLDTCGMQ